LGAGGDGYTVITAPGWISTQNFTVVVRGAPTGFPTPSDPGPPDRGDNFFAGGPDDGSSSATQLIDVSASALAVDAGCVKYNLTGWLGGFGGQDDNAIVRADFQDAGGGALGSALIGPVLAAER
jgi:hypothetical protein